jgi:tetratricopeptide (TPR) repeat protein
MQQLQTTTAALNDSRSEVTRLRTEAETSLKEARMADTKRRHAEQLERDAQGRADEAEGFLSRAVDEARRGFGEGDGHVAAAYQNLAELLRLRGDLERAEGFYLQALRILEAGAAPGAPGAPGGAEGSPFPRQTTAPNEQVAGAALGAAQHNVAGFYLVKGDLRQARAYYERALATKAQALGPRHQECAATSAHLAEVLRRQGERTDALRLLRFSVEVLEDLGQGGSPQGVRRTLRLAELLAIGGASGAAGRAEAAGLLERARSQLEDSEGAGSSAGRRVGRELAALLVERAARGDGDDPASRPDPALPRESALLLSLGGRGSGGSRGSERPSAAFADEAVRLLRTEEGLAASGGGGGPGEGLSQSLLARAEALRGALGPARTAAGRAAQLAAARLEQVEEAARKAPQSPGEEAARRRVIRQLMVALEGFCHVQLSLAGVSLAEGNSEAAAKLLDSSLAALERVESAVTLLAGPSEERSSPTSGAHALPNKALAAWGEQLRRVRADFHKHFGGAGAEAP